MKNLFCITLTIGFCFLLNTAYTQVQPTTIDSTFYNQVKSSSDNSTEFTLKPNTTYDSIGIPVDVRKDLCDTLTLLPGTHAKIRLPHYFEPFAYEKFAGFIHKGTSTSILANEYPGTVFTTITSQITQSTFTKQGAELLEEFDLKQTDGRPAKVYIMRFKTKTAPVIRIMCFTGDYQTTYNLIANIPEVVSNLIRNVILESFRTLEY